MSKPSEKMKALLDSEGMSSPSEFLKCYGLDEVVPAICTEPECDYTDMMEPDQDRGWCPDCKKNTLKSGLILLGVI